MRLRVAAVLALSLSASLSLWMGAGVGPAGAEVPIESLGQGTSLPQPPRPHWVWVSDALLRRSALVDLDAGRFLGMVNGGWGNTLVVAPRGRPELYVPETHYSRGSRGTRTDVVTIYDAGTLAPVDEVEIPPKRAANVLPVGDQALSDDERFLAVFNMTPATSLSIVDVERRRFVEEVATPGCSLVYGAGERRFVMLCADGALLSVTLDEEGRELAKQRSEPFFDPERDPVTEKAVRFGDQWLFASFEGWLHAVDVSGETPRALERWSLLDAQDREQSWRIGGNQHLAVHEDSGRLYSLVHQGGVDSHKDPGKELWVYDLAERRRVQRIVLENPGFTYLGSSLAFGADWVWPFNRLYDWLLAVLPFPGVGIVTVTQDAQPLLVTGSEFSGSLAVYDALSGAFLRRVLVGNATSQVLQAPWRGEGAR